MHLLHLQRVFSWKAVKELLPSRAPQPYLVSCSALQRAEIVPRVLPKVCEQSDGSAVKSCWHDPSGAESPQAKDPLPKGLTYLHCWEGSVQIPQTSWSKPAASSSFSSSFCPLDPSFCLVCHLHINPCFYHINPCFYLFIVLSPAPAVLVCRGKKS